MCVLYATCRISIYLLCMVHSSQLCENALPGVSDRRWHPVRARDHGPYQENVLREQGFVVAAVAVVAVEIETENWQQRRKKVETNEEPMREALRGGERASEGGQVSENEQTAVVQVADWILPKSPTEHSHHAKVRGGQLTRGTVIPLQNHLLSPP